MVTFENLAFIGSFISVWVERAECSKKSSTSYFEVVVPNSNGLLLHFRALSIFRSVTVALLELS